MVSATETTSVHKKETTSHLSPYQSYRVYRRSLCADEFTAAESTYSMLDERDELQRTKLLEGCRKSAWFVRNVETGLVHVASNACRLRWCPMCSRAKSSFITHNVRPWIESLPTARFLTLTLKHTNAPLVTQIDKLYADFRKLRKDTQFKKLCVGGVWFFQIKLSSDTEQWHPHLHCILAGKWISHDWLSKKWLQITRSSNIVDIRMVYDPDKAANEVARYSATPAELSKLDDDRRVEVFDAMHRRRMCGTWGIAKMLSLSPPRSVEKGRYEDLGSYAVVLGMADTDESARKIYAAWVQQKFLRPGIKMQGIDAFLDELPYNLQSDIDAGKFDPVLDFK